MIGLPTRRGSAGPARDSAWWAETAPRRPTRHGVRRSAQYVKVADGTKIAIDLLLPGDLGRDETVPTIITQTPYFRAAEFRHPAFEKIAAKLAFLGTEDFAKQCVAFGYAFVLMDLRGSGASYGIKDDHVMRDGARDGSDVIDWITAQPWSNGRVGATGVSGHGLCATWLTTAGNPALRAVVPRYTAFDNFTATHPGGTVATRFMRDIGALVSAMDGNRLWDLPDSRIAKILMRTLIKGIKPADDDHDRTQLAEAVLDHEGNKAVVAAMTNVTFRDDVSADDGSTLDDDSLCAAADEIVAAGVPIYAHAGWMDAAFGRELINLHTNISQRIPGSKLIIGPWGHGGKFFSSPTATGKTPTAFDHAAEVTRFLDWHLRDVPAPDEEAIHYFTMGEDAWKSTSHWPVAATMTPWHLSSGRSLTRAVPEEAATDARRTDFEHGSGVHSRFGKHLTSELFPVSYPDRATRDRTLLTYDSGPLPAELEVTGHPVVHLHLESTAPEALVIVYLEDVDPSGVVRTVADGWLLARSRAVSDAEPPYLAPGPHHTFRRVDAAPLVPGEVADISFDLYPTSWLFRRGHRIRVAIAGADKDNLQETSRADSPTVTVHHGGARLSRIELPVVSPG